MEKPATGKTSTKDFIHVLKNPLLSIRLNAELLRTEIGEGGQEMEESFRSSCDSIVSEAERLELIVERFLNAADKR
ncbi:MAG: histidine kinase dimerization/phospho-acceptor domain-containing protein [bacterium]